MTGRITKDVQLCVDPTGIEDPVEGKQDYREKPPRKMRGAVVADRNRNPTPSGFGPQVVHHPLGAVDACDGDPSVNQG